LVIPAQIRINIYPHDHMYASIF